MTNKNINTITYINSITNRYMNKNNIRAYIYT